MRCFCNPLASCLGDLLSAAEERRGALDQRSKRDGFRDLSNLLHLFVALHGLLVLPLPVTPPLCALCDQRDRVAWQRTAARRPSVGRSRCLPCCPFLDLRPCLPRRDQRPLPWAALGTRVRVLSGSRRTYEAFSDCCPRLPRSPSRHSHVPEASAKAIGPHAAICGRGLAQNTPWASAEAWPQGPGPSQKQGN